MQLVLAQNDECRRFLLQPTKASLEKEPGAQRTFFFFQCLDSLPAEPGTKSTMKVLDLYLVCLSSHNDFYFICLMH